MAEQQDPSGDRPSFATFWRNSQNESTAKELKFIQSVPGQTNTKEKNQETDKLSKNKRRAQVRKAQVQHRQRKADYVRQLEDNIAGIRDRIAVAEEERRGLIGENEAIRARLAAPAGLDDQVAPVLSCVPMLDNGKVPLQLEGFDVDIGFGTYYFPLDPGMDDYVDVAFDTFGLSSCINPESSTSGYSSP